MVEALVTSPTGLNALPMIRDLPDMERPRERLLLYGPARLNNAELLAILLRTGRKGESALGLAQRLLAEFRSLKGIATAPYAEFSDVKGISDAKYCELMAALELGKRVAASTGEDRVTVRAAKDVAGLLLAEMAELTQEELRVLLLSTKNRVEGIRTIYTGTVNTSLVRAAEVFRYAIRDNYPAIILVHNHPSGDPQPSPQDIDLTRQLVEAGKLLNVELTDHVIVGRDGYVSLKERRAGFA